MSLMLMEKSGKGILFLAWVNGGGMVAGKAGVRVAWENAAGEDCGEEVFLFLRAGAGWVSFFRRVIVPLA